MKNNISLLIGLFIVITIQAQENYSTTFGRVTQYEMSMTSYEKDPDAGAVVLYEKGNTYFEIDQIGGGFRLNMTRSIKIKILNQSGLDYANWEIPYYVSDRQLELIENLSATTYNYEDNRLILNELDRKNIFEETVDANWRIKKFAMPNVKVGSVIEIQYTITSPFLFNIRAWEFQKDIPVIQSLYELKVTPYYEYAYIAKGATKFDIFKREVLGPQITWGRLKYQEVLYTIGMNDIPAFKDQEFITSPKDYKISLHFQLSVIHFPDGGKRQIMTTWPALCNEYLKDDEFGKYINSAEKEAKKILPEIAVNDSASSEEKIEAITNYVKHNYNWTGMNAKRARNKLSKVLKDKQGNTAELNLFLLGLLKHAGFDAKPVVLSTRNHGAVDMDYPFEEFLNYVIVQVTDGDKTYFLDATEPMLSFNELPTRCMNVQGLIVQKDSELWIPITQQDLALTEKSFILTPDEESSRLKAEIRYDAYNYDGYSYRRVYYGEESRLKDYLKDKDVQVDGDITVMNYGDLDKPFSFSFESESPLEGTGEKIFIAPFLNQSQTENIFTQKERKLSIDLIYVHAGKYNSRIIIPAGYQVEHLPKATKMDNRFMFIKYDIEQIDNEIVVKVEYQFKSNYYEAKDYAALKECFNIMVKAFNEMIILSKI